MLIQRVVRLAAAATLAFGAAAPAAAQDSVKKRKVAFVLSSAETRYTETRDVILERVKAAGRGGLIETSEHVLDKDKSKAQETIAKIAANADILVVMGSVAAVAAQKTVKDKPVVFGHVFNPVEAGVIKDWENSGNNFTGGSNYVSLSKFIVRLNDEIPLKRVGVLFTPGEKQSELHLADYRKGAQVIKAEIVVINVADEKDAAALGPKLKGLDAVFLTGGTPIGGNLPKIVEAAVKAKVPSAAHTDSFIFSHPGVLLGVTCPAAEVGAIAGDALVKVLGGIEPSAIPSRSPLPQMVMNGRTAKAQSFVPSEKMKQWITRVVE